MRGLGKRQPRGALWRNADFLWLWLAQTVSQFGSQVTSLALPLVAILVLEASTFEIAMLTVFNWVPFVFFSLPAGVWIDRIPRRRLLIAADWGRMIALSSIALAYLVDALSIAHLYVVSLVAGTLTMIFDLSYQSYLPSVVRRQELGEGNAKLEVSRSASQIAGPGLAGILVSVLTAPYAILVDAASFVASALSLSRIRRREEKPKAWRSGRNSFRAEMREGLGFTLRHPIQRPIIAFVAGSNLFVNMLFAIYLVYAVRELNLSATTIGVIAGLGNVGSLVGALTANRVARTFGIGPALLIVATAGALGLLLIPLARGVLVIPFFVIAQVLWGFFVLNYFVTAVSLIQAITPDRLLGRANASRRFIVQSMIPVGAVLGGALGTFLGLRTTVAIGAVGATLSVTPLFFSRLPAIRETADAEEMVRDYNEKFLVSQNAIEVA